MNKFLKVASIVATGAALGALAGKIATQEISRYKKQFTDKTARNVQQFLDRSSSEDEQDFSFI
jgi:hypothetical protein